MGLTDCVNVKILKLWLICVLYTWTKARAYHIIGHMHGRKLHVHKELKQEWNFRENIVWKTELKWLKLTSKFSKNEIWGISCAQTINRSHSNSVGLWNVCLKWKLSRIDGDIDCSAPFCFHCFVLDDVFGDCRTSVIGRSFPSYCQIRSLAFVCVQVARRPRCFWKKYTLIHEKWHISWSSFSEKCPCNYMHPHQEIWWRNLEDWEEKF